VRACGRAQRAPGSLLCRIPVPPRRGSGCAPARDEAGTRTAPDEASSGAMCKSTWATLKLSRVRYPGSPTSSGGAGRHVAGAHARVTASTAAAAAVRVEALELPRRPYSCGTPTSQRQGKDIDGGEGSPAAYT
jgi:hypothetical protein